VGQLDEAIAAYREAIRLKKDDALAHYNLGNALRERGQWDEAIACYREAIRLKKDFALAHNNLGVALRHQGRLDEAIAAYREAIRLKKDYADAHCNLGLALCDKGRFAEALTARRRGHELGSRNPRWSYPSAQWVRETERLVALDARLPHILEEKATPAHAPEYLELARFCQRYKQDHVTAAKLYGLAFTVQPALADNLEQGHRSQAARSAALAAAGQGRDPGKLTDEDRTRLRAQALAWLQADVQQGTRCLQARDRKSLPGLLTAVAAWQQEAAFGPLRDPSARARLPADEQKDWAALGAAVAQLAANIRTERFSGSLTAREKEQTHEVPLQAGQVYLIDLESRQFDTYLRLHDAGGKLLAENDDIVPGVILNSRLLFTAPADGSYRLVATSFEQRGTGDYTLTVRSVGAAKRGADPTGPLTFFADPP
jgi:tetratricopeptide (TPR) repeat protein